MESQLFNTMKNKFLRVKNQMDFIVGLKEHKQKVLEQLLEEQNFHINFNQKDKTELLISDLFNQMTTTLTTKLCEVKSKLDLNSKKIEELSKHT